MFKPVQTGLAILLGSALSAAISLAPARAAPAAPFGFVILGEDGARVARAITTADHCPVLTVDGVAHPMSVRAAAGTEPLRPTRSDPAQSKPSVFDALTCEATLPAAARHVRLAGRPLPLPPAVIRRIVVIGDTGCRIKASDHAYQACNDPAAYPFAKVAAQAARWRPDLVVHVGDYLYRENACPDDKPGCAGSPWGYGLDAWRADFFTPAQPLLRAAAWAAVRGNHESCLRAGQGWWRFMDPRPLQPGRDCNDAANDGVGDYSDPFAIPLGEGAQLILFDSANTANGPLKAGDPRLARYQDAYARIEALSRRAPHTILADHHPLLAYAAITSKDGVRTILPGNAGLQSAFAALNPDLAPISVDLLLSGHIHVWEALSFSSHHPAQIVAGFSGTEEDIVPLPAQPPADPAVAPGAVVEAMSSWVNGFGFMTLTRTGAAAWTAEVRDQDGKVVNTCAIDGRKLRCAKATVSQP